MEIERFFAERRSSPSSFPTHHRDSTIPNELRQSANRGLLIFPVNRLAKLKGECDLLIGEATCDVFRLDDFAAEYPFEWRVAIGPSLLCVLHMAGLDSRESVAALSENQGECLTVQSRRGDAAWAFFRWPAGLVRRSRNLAPGLKILGPGDSCILPPSGGCVFTNPWAEVEAVPPWLRDVAFEPEAAPPGNPVPVIWDRRPRCLSLGQFSTPLDARKRPQFSGHAVRRGGYRMPSRR
jgi:hypothetical protein